jgi:hypothetical protein
MILAEPLINYATRREPDFTIGRPGDTYLQRWYLIPKNRLLNIYIHRFIRSDDDRALHDHPWACMSILLRGRYVEHTVAAGGIHVRTERCAGDWKLRLLGGRAHRLELTHGECWTLFITGPKYREWGFHCAERGWVHWKKFTAPHNKGEIGQGCSE